MEEKDDLIDTCFEEASNLTINEKSTLYYISGYVARKENLSTCHTSPNLPESEFTDLVSRGKLVHPPAYRNTFFLFSKNASENVAQNFS